MAFLLPGAGNPPLERVVQRREPVNTEGGNVGFVLGRLLNIPIKAIPHNLLLA